MLTFGLNRHLYSFGLSYPGYWFVLIEPGVGTPERRVFLVHESRMYEVHEIIREFKPKGYRMYKARITTTQPRIYYVAAIGRYYVPHDTRFFKSAVYQYQFLATETPRVFKIQEARTSKVSENSRVFKVRATREYNL